MAFKKSQQEIDFDTENTINIIEERGDVYVEGTCDNQQSKLVVWCPKQNTISNILLLFIISFFFY